MRTTIVAIVLVPCLAGTVRADAVDRLEPERLAAVHKAVLALRSDWQKLARAGPYQDFRANLHVHSSLSHDSRGTLDEIVAAAKKAGTKVLMFTEHPSDKIDYFKDGHRGIKDGVLLIPGAETRGFLAFPTLSLHGLEKNGTPQEFSDLVRGRGGMTFLSHLEERMDWEIRHLTGTEIYNTHADLKDEKRLMANLRNPLWFLQAAQLFPKYPQEAFSALQDYPRDYLKRWDELCLKAPHTGVAANDSHQNLGLIVRLLEGEKASFEDALGKKLIEVGVGLIPSLAELRKDKKVGDVLFQLRLDPYEYSLRHVGTHLLLDELSEKAVRAALEAGRAYVAFDWLADASGFDFAAVSAKMRHEMGSNVPFEKGLQLEASAPLPVQWKVVRQGKVVTEARGRTLQVPVGEAGNYRVEAWLTVAGEEMIWVLSNPVYVQAAK